MFRETHCNEVGLKSSRPGRSTELPLGPVDSFVVYSGGECPLCGYPQDRYGVIPDACKSFPMRIVLKWLFEHYEKQSVVQEWTPPVDLVRTSNGWFWVRREVLDVGAEGS